MKVLYCHPGMSFEADARIVTVARASGMREAGLDVTIMGPDPGPWSQLTASVLPYVSAHPSGLRKRRPLCLSLRRLAGAYWTFIAEPWLVTRAGMHCARQLGFDVLFLAHVESWLVWLMIRRWRRQPLPVVAGRLFGVYQRSPNRPLSSQIRAAMNAWATRRLPRFLTLVFDTVHAVRAAGLSPGPGVAVIPDGYRPNLRPFPKGEARQRLGLPEAPRMLLLFGVARRDKGADLLLQALQALPATFEVCLVGQTGGVYEASWSDVSFLRSSGWSTHVHVVDRKVSEEELDLYFSACDAVVLPYRRGFHVTSGNLRLAVEYGKAMIVSDQYFLGEVVRRHRLGWWFEPENVVALREVLQGFARCPDSELTAIAERCRALATAESWKATGEAYAALFNQLLNGAITRKTAKGWHR